MKFSDNIVRNQLDTVFVIRTEKEMEEREEFNSNLWELQRENFLKEGNNIYSIPVRDLKVGESIYTKDGRFISYRSN
jgi:prolyl oligopeptidase PreP (S9A serine peptidase family)